MTDTISIKRQFFDSLKRGTGEAFILTKENPGVDFSDLIIKGATTNFAYDPQSEGSRANYIYQFIKKSKQKDKIINAVLTRLQSEKTDYYGLDQMCDLAVKFYKSGHSESKTALYNRFEKNRLKDYEFCGQAQLMEIDGLNGVLKVAEVIGKTLFDNPEDSEDSWRIDDFQKRNKAIDVYKELKKAASKNKYIKSYYASIKKNNWILPKHKRIARFSYDIIKEKITANRLRILSEQRANELTIGEVIRLANEFLLEKDFSKKEQYLIFFSYRKFPFDYTPILKIASGKNPKNTRLVPRATEALKYFSSKEIRKLAVDKIKSVKNPTNYMSLLVSNYKKGDYKLLTEVANRSDNYDYIHSIVSGFVDIYQVNSTEECKQPLEVFYDKMNCGLHRVGIINILSKNKVLSDKILNELPFDSDDEIRKIYRKKKNVR